MYTEMYALFELWLPRDQRHTPERRKIEGEERVLH